MGGAQGKEGAAPTGTPGRTVTSVSAEQKSEGMIVLDNLPPNTHPAEGTPMGESGWYSTEGRPWAYWEKGGDGRWTLIPDDDGEGGEGAYEAVDEMLDKFHMDDEVARQTAELLFDLLPYFGSGENDQADQIFLETLESNEALVNCVDLHANTLLMVAAQHVKPQLIDIFVKKGASVNAQNYMGISTMHIICYETNDKSYSMAERLIRAGADLKSQDSEGCTPLHYAASAGDSKVTALLLMYGADPLHVDKRGFMAQDYAVQGNHKRVVDLLYNAASAAKGSDDEADDEHEEQIKVAEKQVEQASKELWQEYIDPASNCPYYYNVLTGETTWERPAEFQADANSAAVEMVRRSSQRVRETKGSDDVGALLAKWKQVAWREGMRKVVEKQKAQTRRFAMEQAKARMYLMKEGGEEAQKTVQEELGVNDKEMEALKAKLAAFEQAQSLNDQKMEAMKKELEAKNAEMNRVNANLDHMKAEQSKKADDFAMNATAQQREIEEKMARQVAELRAQLDAKDSELGNVQSQLSETKAKAEAETSAAHRAAAIQAKAMQDEAAAEMEKIRRDMAERDAQLAAVQAEASALKSNAEKTDEELKRARELASRQAELEYEAAENKAQLESIQKNNDKLRKDYLAEQRLRRKYHNEVEDLKGAIRVFCRVRPLSNSEKERGNFDCTTIDDFSIQLAHDGQDKTFEFDRCFGPTSTQEEVFEDTRRLVQSAIDGFNVCVFAYGQTGSGKTFTMSGAGGGNFPGITPRTVEELFAIQTRDQGKFKYKFSFYMLELYKDYLVDLLYRGNEDQRPKLQIKKDSRGVVYIAGSKVEPAASAEAMNGLIQKGFDGRHVASTKMNSESSRSHLIMAIIIETTNLSTNVSSVGKLSLVDLAGSERAGKTGATGEQMKEAQSINKSLSALGDVIGALTSGQKHVPYRNHPLTMLMSDSLGGNAKTLMFVNASPAEYNIAETINALDYAKRVKTVTNVSSKTVETEAIKELKKQLAALKKGP